MTKANKQTLLAVGIILTALIADQVLKVYIKTHFQLGEAHEVTSWFWICFVENNGMAFGIEWFSKLALTLFRIVVVGILCWLVHRQVYVYHARTGFVAMLALVIAGAIGNIIDCIFYGKIWGYADWMYGRVVDMFYFPLIHNSAGEVVFFRPVFNIADSCITCAVIAILLFYRHDLNAMFSEHKTPAKHDESK